MNFAHYLLENTGEKTTNFVLGSRCHLTYQDLNEKVNALASYLTRKFGCGHEILLNADNSTFFIIAYLGIIRSGNTAAVIETRISDAHLNDILCRCSISAILVQNRYRQRFEDSCEILGESFLESLPAEFSPPEVESDDDDTAVILFTSGSTGQKKGVMLSHKNLRANTDSIIRYLELTAADRIYAVLPFSYTFGTSLLNTHLRVGGSVVLGNPIFLGSILNEMNAYECTGFAGVPSTYQILINKTDFLQRSFPTLRYFQQAGGHLADKFKLMIAEAFTDKQFYTMYGLTEATARCSYLPPHLLREKPGSIGRGIPGVRLEVIKPDGTLAQPHEIGEITVVGDNVMKGYYKDPEATRERIRDGRLYTGDIATVDEEGDVYYLERRSSIIKSGGFRISPKEVEGVINSIDGVSLGIVMGIIDELLGESVGAVVRPENGSNRALYEMILQGCGQELPSYKIPRKILFLDEFPLNSSLKYDMERLKQLLESNEGEQGKNLFVQKA
ncbi:MAG: AMP-binding protein [Methanomicrobiaceae archaeon]|nr:AMP-binding protein [Methanomicrobiaceae archaeon]